LQGFASGSARFSVNFVELYGIQRQFYRIPVNFDMIFVRISNALVFHSETNGNKIRFLKNFYFRPLDKSLKNVYNIIILYDDDTGSVRISKPA